MKIKYIFLTLLISSFGFISSCKEDDDDIEIISPLAGDYVGDEDCSGTKSHYQVDIYNTSFGKDQIWIHNAAGTGKDIKATVSGNSFTAAEQEITIGSTKYKLSANGSVDENTLTMSYKFVYPNGTFDECTYTGVSD